MKDNFSTASDIKGYIGYYGLADWWLDTFTSNERQIIDRHYQPIGQPPHALTQGDIGHVSMTVDIFLNSLKTWFHKPGFSSVEKRIEKKIEDLENPQSPPKPGYINERHYTTFVNKVEDLKKSGKLDEAERLLLKIVDAVETEDRIQKMGVAPWYYYQLAIIYRKHKRIDKEIEILERFARQRHAPGAKPLKLMERLKKVREISKG